MPDVESGRMSPRPYRFKIAPPKPDKEDCEYSGVDFWFVNFGLLSCYVVCGLVIAALGASVQDIAQNVGKNSTDIASVYVARGFGSVLGSFFSAPIFTHLNAVGSLMATYVATVMVMAWIPFIENLMNLHIAYFLVGVLTSLISAGSILLIRKIHHKNAGPWLGALGAALVSAGVVVPAVQMVFASLLNQFGVYCVVILLGLLWLRALPKLKEDIHSSTCSPSSNSNSIKPPDPASATADHLFRSAVRSLSRGSREGECDYDVEDTFFMTPVASVSSFSSSCFYTSLTTEKEVILMRSASDLHRIREGSDSSNFPSEARPILCRDDAATSHGTFDKVVDGCVSDIDDVGDSVVPVVPPHYYSDAVVALMILFIIGGGTAFAIYLETYVDDTPVLSSDYKAVLLMVFFMSATVANVAGIFAQIDISDKSLSRLTTVVLMLGVLGMLLVILFPDSRDVLWIGVTLFGFSSAITVGFCFNIANRLSYPSAKSTSIIMIGSSVGVSFIPYITSCLYSRYNFPMVVMWMGMVSMAVPIALLYIAPHVSYLKGVHSF